CDREETARSLRSKPIVQKAPSQAARANADCVDRRLLHSLKKNDRAAQDHVRPRGVQTEYPAALFNRAGGEAFDLLFNLKQRQVGAVPLLAATEILHRDTYSYPAHIG